MKHAEAFWGVFTNRFQQLCAARPGAPDFWTDDTAWTKLMLRDEQCFLRNVVEGWAERTGLRTYSIEKEWLKFDLMVISPGQSGGMEWWRSIPIAAIEHENGDGIHDEVWKLACWRARLKVLITYHRDDDALNTKLGKARDIIRSVEAEYGPETDAEWLFLSAPRTFAGGNGWTGRTWTSGDWKPLA